MQDLQLAVRALRAAPIVTLVAAFSLALGIGANTAIFSLVNSLLLRPLPVAEPERLVTVSSPSAIKMGFEAGLGWNYAMWDQLRQRSQMFDGAYAWSSQRLDLAQGGETQPVAALLASGDFFKTLGVSALVGRTFTSADDVRGGGADGPVALISYELWQQRFGGAASVIGTPVVIERVPFTIVGVTQQAFLGLEVGRPFDVALPLGTEPLIRGARTALDARNNLFLFIMLRLKPGQSLEAANATIRAMQSEILDLTPGQLTNLPVWLKEPFTLVPAAAGTSGTEPGARGLRQTYQRPLVTVFVVAALVLLVACLNIANLQLVRAAARQHELSVRRALGAPRWRLARQLLVESLVLAGIGAAGGVMFAAWGSRALVAQLTTSVNRVVLDQTIDWRVLGFTTGVSIATALLFGIAPAFRATRVAPIEAMKERSMGAESLSRRSSPGNAERRPDRSRRSLGRGVSGGLVIAQVALSLVLIVAAGLFAQTFERLSSVSLGFDSDRVLVVNVDTARANVDPTARLPYYHQLVDAVVAAPGVAHAGGSMWTPASGGGGTIGIQVPGAPMKSEAIVLFNFVTPGWFAAYGTPIHHGRDFDARDTASAPAVVMVNDAFMRQFFPGRGGSAIGATIARPTGATGGAQPKTLIGVVADQLVHGGFRPDGTSRSLREEAPATIYMPLAQSAGSGPPGRTSLSVSVRASGGSPLPLGTSVGAALSAVDRNLAFSFRPLTEQINAALAQERLVAMLSGFFGALALLLAGLGLYGVTAYAVGRRRAEIGIRLALGAEPGRLVWLVLMRVLLLVTMGVLAGVATSAWLARFAAPLLYGLQPHDPGTLLFAALTLIAVGALAAWFPAFRGSRIDPAEVLRTH